MEWWDILHVLLQNSNIIALKYRLTSSSDPGLIFVGRSFRQRSTQVPRSAYINVRDMCETQQNPSSVQILPRQNANCTSLVPTTGYIPLFLTFFTHLGRSLLTKSLGCSSITFHTMTLFQTKCIIELSCGTTKVRRFSEATGSNKEVSLNPQSLSV